MTTPQKAIFIEGTKAFSYLEYKLDYSSNRRRLKDALGIISDLNTETSSVVICFGRQAWDWLNPSWAPASFAAYTEVRGAAGYVMPSTQRDLFFWINSDRKDSNFDVAQAIQNSLKDVATLELEQDGFRYHDSRDLTGFIDGTENPIEDERFGIALIPDGESGAGGSHVFSQKWIHDLESFQTLPEKMQEKIIGRTKPDSVELKDDDMPEDSHVSRADAKVDGVAMKIYRRSTPYGNLDENGLFFLAFACDPYRIQIQLERMTGATEDKIHDKLMEFSKPVTGSYWFAPSSEDLIEILK